MNRLFPLAALLIFSATACDKDDPVIENEEELITDVIYQLRPVGGGGGEVTLTFSDPDGDGPEASLTNVTGSLAANTLYDGTLIVANLSDSSNPQDVTSEVIDEAEDHQFFYLPSAGLEATLTYRDTDSDGNPLGVLTQLETGGFSSGTLTIILRHLPAKSDQVGIADTDAAGGETDIEVTFPVSIGN